MFKYPPLGRPVLVRSACVAIAVFALLSTTAALADPASDEASRQNMMADMRANTAANDRANFDSLQRNKADFDRTHNSGGTTSGSTASASSPGNYGAQAASREAADSGSRSVVATYTFTIHRQETAQALANRLEQEAGAGNATSAFNLGRVLYTGFDGVPRDDNKARHWFGEAAKLGHPGAQSQFGFMLHDGIGGPKDVELGLDWLRKAATQGDTYGEALYGFYLVRAPAAGADLSEPIAYLTRAADKGQLVAQVTLGTIVYELGVGATVDWDKAAHYARLGADQNNALAEVELGRMYLTGHGVPKDDAAGIVLIRRAAAQQDASAMALLGQLAMTGRGMVQDESAGARWFQQAADAGDVHSATIYGSLLIMGQGVTKDEASGARYTMRAAEAGDVDAQINLAKDYYFGHGVGKDIGQSLVWFRKAAAQGNQQAIALLRSDQALIAAANGH
jgi:TPR repeat protein